MDLSIIFVNWNAVDYLCECITSIYENTKDISLEIIVFDNASPDGNVDTLKEPFPQITIIKSPENLGFAKANNLGFKHSTGALVLILNPDTKLVGPAINLLVDEMKKWPDAGIIGGRHLSPDLTVQTTSIQKFPSILSEVLSIEYLRLRWPHFRLWDIAPLFSSSREVVQVEVIPGACMLLRREVFENVGGFSEDYFIYAEDIDLNVKVARTGLKNYYVPEATIIHYGGKSSSQQKVSQWATVMKLRAMGQFYVKNHGRAYAAMYRAAMGACAVIRVVLMTLAYPVGVLLRKKDVLRSALEKWTVVLKWACGLDQQVLNGSSSRPRK
ncbi:MAG: glycosyltransferase family 2 protein [Terriglobia bacterium]